MATKQFTDSIGDTNTIGADGKVYTQGGTFNTGYTMDQWNQRQLTKGNNKSSGSGSSGMSSTSSGMPTININELYQKELNSPDITNLQKEIDTKKQGYNTAVTNINDNPYASEATRVGKIRRLDESAQKEIQSLEGNLAQRKADAQVKMNIAMQQYQVDSQSYQNELNKLNMLISSGALLNANSSDIAQVAMATGLTTSMVRSIQSKMKSDQIKPQVITSTNDAGVVTVSVVDGNTGQIIGQNSLGAIGNKQGGSGSSDATQLKLFNSAIADGIQQLKQGEDWGTVYQRILAQFDSTVPAEEIPLLQNRIDAGLGISWREGGAYEQYAKRLAENKGSSQPNIIINNPGN